MSDETIRDLVVRMATDPAFAQQVRTDPADVAAAHGLTVEQVAALAQLGTDDGTAGPSMLDTRLSKSSLFFGGGLHVDPHALAAPSFEAQTGSAGFEDLGLHPTNTTSFEDLGLHPTNTTGFEDLGLHPTNTTSFEDLGLHPTNTTSFEDLGLHPAGVQDHGVHPAPVSLLTGKIVAPVDSHTADVTGPSDSHTAGIVAPTDSHAAKGTHVDSHGVKGIVGPVDPPAAGHAEPTV